MKFVKKLIAVLIATQHLCLLSALNSVCMAVRDNRAFAQILADQIKANEYYALKMLQSIPKDEGLKKSNQDGNYFKKDKLNDEEKEIYDQIINEANKIKNSIPKDSDYEVKLARDIFFWIRKNISYDETSVNLGHDQEGMQIVNPNRKPQDALSVFKARKGVCAGVADLARVFMREVGLPCMTVCNYDHKFNVVWLDFLGGWALFDATFTEDMKLHEEQASQQSQSGKSADEIGLIDNFTAVADPEKYSLEENNKYFMGQWGTNHHVYTVYDLATGFAKFSLELNETAYIPLPKFIDIKSDNNSIIIDEDVLSMNENCKIKGNVENIQNFDVFAKKFVKVNISESHVRETLNKDGFEFKLFSDGNKSRLEIKPSEDNVSHDEVKIPDELVPFLADIDVFDVDYSIKIVKYDLLREGHALKQSAVPNGVKFEKIIV